MRRYWEVGMTIKASISWFVESQTDVDFIKSLIEEFKVNVQLAFYSRKSVEWANSFLGCSDERITSIHLPKGMELVDYKEGGVVETLRHAFNVDLFVVHPWAHDLDAIVKYVAEKGEFCLCLENFASKSSKGSPFRLLANYGKLLKTENLGLCIDLSHLNPSLCNHDFIRGVLPYTKMIHASNQLGKAKHLPIFRSNSDINALNLIGQLLSVKELKVREIVIEYMKEYQKDTVKHVMHVSRWIAEKRKRWGGANAS